MSFVRFSVTLHSITYFPHIRESSLPVSSQLGLEGSKTFKGVSQLGNIYEFVLQGEELDKGHRDPLPGPAPKD